MAISTFLWGKAPPRPATNSQSQSCKIPSPPVTTEADMAPTNQSGHISSSHLSMRWDVLSKGQGRQPSSPLLLHSFFLPSPPILPSEHSSMHIPSRLPFLMWPENSSLVTAWDRLGQASQPQLSNVSSSLRFLDSLPLCRHEDLRVKEMHSINWGSIRCVWRYCTLHLSYQMGVY